MKTTIKVALAALTIASLAFSGCKKGEGDPFLSLKTRKGRIHGEWKITKGEGTRSYVFANTTVTETISYDGTTETTTTNPGNSTSTSKWTQTYEFEKDGAFTSTYTDNDNNPAVTTTMKGTWNWTGGVGDMKNKSQIVLTVTESTTGSSTSTYTGSSCPTMVYDVYELKSKEMIFQDKGTQSSGSENTDKKWTLEKQ